MKLKPIIIGTIMICITCNAQQKEMDTICYQKSKGFIKNRLPGDICIGKGELIYTLFDKFDFNSDGLQDLAIEKGGNKLVNGMQTVLIVYQKVNDSRYTKFKEFGNVYPLWFENYHPHVKVNDPQLDAIKEYYEGNPLRWIELVDNKIVLTLNGDVVTEYILTYTYSNEKKDWLLTDYVEYNLHNNVKKPFPSDKTGTSISEFSYLKFMNGEY